MTFGYEISSDLFYQWNDQYAKGQFNNEPIKEAAFEDRISYLEQLVGKLTLENESQTVINNISNFQNHLLVGG